MAPEIGGAIAWLNCEQPLTLSALRGCVVVIDFWTYCCINCMHVLPTLREIERRHAHEPVVVIGVHSGKFNAEQDPARIREAIGRYGVEHPVAVDDDMGIWSRYGIRSWPTLVVVRADGTIAAMAPGEPDVEVLDGFVRRELEQARAAGILLPRRPVIVNAAREDPGPLRYPGKVAPHTDGRLAIADSGHHRVLICTERGQVLTTAGSGQRGWADGPANHAAFDDPQGLCWYDGDVYVADTRNHAIRRVNAQSGEVTTVAGTGEIGSTPPNGRVTATRVALRSPWDLCTVGSSIYAAMAGGHQIWRLQPSEGQIEVFAGTGIEALNDGPVEKSCWAQPSGLSEQGGVLYVADSETSALRAIDLGAGTVRTLVGQGLFDFGDGEGDASAAVLQHCLDVAATTTGVLIADTYNGKLKRWVAGGELEQGEISTELDQLSEPGGVAIAADGAVIIADTNAHRIVRFAAGELRPIEIVGAPSSTPGSLQPPAPPEVKQAPMVRGWFTSLLELPEGVGLRQGDGGITLILRAPPGTHLAAGSPMHVTVEVSRRSDLLIVERSHFSLEAHGGPSQIVHIEVRVEPPTDAREEAELVAIVDYLACDEHDQAMCSPGRLHVRIPVRLLSWGGRRELEFGINLASVGG